MCFAASFAAIRTFVFGVFFSLVLFCCFELFCCVCVLRTLFDFDKLYCDVIKCCNEEFSI